VGSAQFGSLPTSVLFTPEEADGTDPQMVGAAEDGVLFTITFTEVQFKGETDVFKGKVNLRLEVGVDLNNDNVTDWVAQLGTNVDVTNTDLVETSDFLNVWIVDPEEGDQVSGVVEVKAAPETSVTVSQVQFFVNGSSIGTDTDGSNGWSILWDTTGLANGDYQLTAVASGGGLSATSSAVTVTVNNSGQPVPEVTLTADPESVTSGDSSTLSWISTNATSCTASGGWSGDKATSGSESTGALTETTSYTLSCSGPGGTAQSSVTVSVGPYFSGSSTPGERGTWSATVSVTGGPTNTLISGTWSTGGTPNSCTTDSTGACTIMLSGIRNNTRSVTWTYTATGQTVTISRP
jgi:hypothetical protein